MIREIIMQALFAKLTAAPLVVQFTADTTTGDTALANVSDTTGLLVGMPVTGDGLAEDVTITAIDPVVTISQPAIADRTATSMTQGFQTAARRLADAKSEFDMPALYLVETSEMHDYRDDTAPALVALHCEAWIFTRVGADQDAVPAATLNMLIDGIERAIAPGPRRPENLGLTGVAYCRIEGEIQKDPGSNGALAGAIIPLVIKVSQASQTSQLS